MTGLRVGMGAEAIRELLMAVDLDKESKDQRSEIIENNQSGAKRLKAVKRIEIIEAFRKQRQQARMDDHDRSARYPARTAPHGAVGRRQVSRPAI